MTKNSRRSHDAFFRWLFADENHLRALLKLSAKSNLEIQQFLAAVDPNTFVRIPDSYSNVDETGEADLAFRVNASSGNHALVGVLLEHKSGPDSNTLEQMEKYVNSVMKAYAQSHSATRIPTVAILFYNGKGPWDPFKILRKNYSDYFFKSVLPYQCHFIDMKMISDEDCIGCDDVATAMGVTAMKYAFNRKKLLAILPKFQKALTQIPYDEAKNLLEKISVYLKEYLGESILKELDMAFVSIGQKYGFVSAGDVFRQRLAAGKAEALAEGISKGRKEGRAEGLSKGLSKGRAEGIRQNTLSLAKTFRNKGFPLEAIADATGLTIDEIKAL
ncbi:MAG: Rpn family recombination-promoting nuclease/putative transposase [Hallerella sp.]|uniref:Rpn family recombination-promoting nuclease/putative transposase n=1 Tax=Hallerella sp. TaxID=2815812 RepID=UPI0025906038|nr:Rpn family recombination-promoting nuclease/putative transposase [Hallerella sp.]MCI5600518.1 Rpn family recombination-promoting nuclease/putative transposase [Hallerella sp.]